MWKSKVPTFTYVYIISSVPLRHNVVKLTFQVVGGNSGASGGVRRYCTIILFLRGLPGRNLTFTYVWSKYKSKSSVFNIKQCRTT